MAEGGGGAGVKSLLRNIAGSAHSPTKVCILISPTFEDQPDRWGEGGFMEIDSIDILIIM